jgi:uncharacterized phage-associated protein
MAFSAKAVANFFLRKAKDEEGAYSLSPMKIQKLVFFAHGWHLALSDDAPLINELVQAWPYGPVIPSLYHEFKHFGNSPITALATKLKWGDNVKKTGKVREYNPTIPTEGNEQLIELLDKVWSVYKKYSAVQLSNMTHAPGAPWSTVSEKYPNGIPKGAVIDNKIISAYFKSQKQK